MPRFDDIYEPELLDSATVHKKDNTWRNIFLYYNEEEHYFIIMEKDCINPHNDKKTYFDEGDAILARAFYNDLVFDDWLTAAEKTFMSEDEAA